MDFKKNNVIGIIGEGFLKVYNMLIDYEKSEVYLRKNQSNDTSINGMISDGFYLVKELGSNKIVVFKVIEAGIFLNYIKIDDEILEVNNTKPRNIDRCEIDKLKSPLGLNFNIK